MRLRFGSLLAVLVLFVIALVPANAQDSRFYNHSTPAAYPDWFVPVGELGVTQWLNSQEEPGVNTTALAHFNYIARTKLEPAALVKLVETYAHAHGFEMINVIDPQQKIVIAEVDLEKNPVAGAQRMTKLHHNRTIMLDAGEGRFALSISENPT